MDDNRALTIAKDISVSVADAICERAPTMCRRLPPL